MSKTSVDFITDIFKRQGFITASQIIEAKHLEKQQIIDAYGKVRVKIDNNGCTKLATAEEYYNETFNQK